MTETFGAIALTQGKWAIIDCADFNRLHRYRWHVSLKSRGTKWYACRTTRMTLRPDRKRFQVFMHHEILGVTPAELRERELVVDHRNHDSLDNRRTNLEEVTQAENMARSRGWKKKGVPVCEPYL